MKFKGHTGGLAIPKWKQVALEEIRILKNNGTWQLVDALREKKPVGYKWVFTMNCNVDGPLKGTKQDWLWKASHKPMGLPTKRHLHWL